MVNHITTPTFRINNADIGRVVFVVEGLEREYEILEWIFVKFLGYEKVGSKNRKPAFLELKSALNPNNRVIIIRAKNSGIVDVIDFERYFDETYIEYFVKRNIDIRYSPIYYIWDRDPGNNTKKHIKDAISLMCRARNEDNVMNGLLLLSYPCVESYLVTCNENLKFFPDRMSPKKYVGDCGFLPRRLDVKKIIFGANAMLKSLLELGIDKDELNLDYFDGVNMKIFEKEEELYSDGAGKYRLLSLISIALIDLGILV